MIDDYLEELRNIAFELTIEPKHRKDHAVGIKALTELLNNIQESYVNYLNVSNSKRKGSPVAPNSEVESDLMIVDLAFSSFHAKLAPDYIGTKAKGSSSMDFPMHTIKREFSHYKNTFLYANYSSKETIDLLMQEFSYDERKLILDPLFKSVNKADSYNVIISNDQGGRYNLTKVPKSVISKLTPPKDKASKENKQFIQKMYAVVTESTEGETKKRKIKKILASEDIPMESMPYLPNKIQAEGEAALILKKRIEVDVVHEDGLFFFSYPDLNIEVWGETRKDAEEAFNFAFFSLYTSIALEEDSLLTPNAQIVKKFMLDLIKVAL